LFEQRLLPLHLQVQVRADHIRELPGAPDLLEQLADLCTDARRAGGDLLEEREDLALQGIDPRPVPGLLLESLDDAVPAPVVASELPYPQPPPSLEEQTHRRVGKLDHL